MNKFDWIRESNLIEGVDDISEDVRSMHAWTWFKDQDITRETILGVHGMVMAEHFPDIAGKFRTVNVRVGHRICPPWEKVEELLEAWFDKHGGAGTAKKIKEAHVAFEKIHPFQDGNGRVGRMILNHQRVNFGLEALVIKSEERWKYYEWFYEQTSL